MTGQALAKTAEQPLSLEDCRISETLLTLLCDEHDREFALSVIADRPHLMAEMRASLPLLERTLIGAGRPVVKEALAPLILIHKGEVGECAKVPAWWGVYYAQLEALPAEAVFAACRDYPGLPDAEFFPKPHRLRSLALKHAERSLTAVSRVRAALRAPPPRQIDRGTAEQRKAQVAEILSCFKVRAA